MNKKEEQTQAAALTVAAQPTFGLFVQYYTNTLSYILHRHFKCCELICQLMPPKREVMEQCKTC